MQPLEKISLLFEEIKKGRYSARDELFETIWLHFTRLTNNPEVDSLFAHMYEWANKHATEHPDFLELTTLSLGFLEFVSDNYDKAHQYLQTAVELFSDTKNDDGIAVCNIALGYIHRSTGEIDLALKHGLQGMEQLTRSGNYKMFQIIGSYWLGGLYADTGQLEEALRLFQQGLQIDYPAGVKSFNARMVNGIAGVYMKQKKFTLALENYQKALELCDDETESTFKARGLTDLGEYYYKMGDYEKANAYNTEALTIRQESKILNGSITNLMNLGDINNKQGNFKEAIKVLTQALKLAEEIKVKSKMYQIHKLLSDIYLGIGNMPESLAHFKAYHEIKEDVNHEDIDRKVKNQLQLFQAQLTQKENTIIKAQKQEIERKNIELQEIIDELTLARISKKARAITLSIGIILFIFQDRILEYVLHVFASENYLLSITIKVAIIFSLEPVNKAIEHYLLRRVIKRQKKEILV